jgi:hypothetical protein
MFSLPYLIARLYPDRTQEQMQKLTDTCFELSAFTRTQWVDQEGVLLSSLQTQLRMIKTLFQAAIENDPAMVLVMLDGLELWTETEPIPLYFSFLDAEQNAFYERFYTAAAFMFFANHGETRQLFLLQSRFLLLAYALDVPVYTSVQEYFKRLYSTNIMQDDARLFANIMHLNETQLGTEKKVIHSIREWLVKFEKRPFTDLSDRVSQFMSGGVEVGRLDEEDKTLLESVLTLYFGLKGGFMWREVKDTYVLPGYEKKIAKENLGIDARYLTGLYNSNEEEFSGWLSDYENFLEWFFVADKGQDFLEKVLFIIRSKADLNNGDHVHNIFQMFDALRELGAENIDEVLYFDEQKGQFVWDDRFFVLPTETNTQKSRDAAQDAVASPTVQ